MTALAEKKCVPCTGGVPPLPESKIQELLREIPTWSVESGRLTRNYTFPDFASALTHVNRIGALAEEQNHHPDIYLTWGKVKVELWTHAINGLTESDFILAAKIEQIS